MAFNHFNDNLHKVPCKECDRRKSNCHARCADYARFLKEKEESRAASEKAHRGDIEASGARRENIQALQTRMLGRKGDRRGHCWTHER